MFFTKELDPDRPRRARFVDEQRGRVGVEPICRSLGESVSAYYQRPGGRRSARAVEDERLLAPIRELHAVNYHAYGYPRMWKALVRAGEQVPRCPRAAADAPAGDRRREPARQALAHDQA